LVLDGFPLTQDNLRTIKGGITPIKQQTGIHCCLPEVVSGTRNTVLGKY
jgi:hypothetical protein